MSASTRGYQSVPPHRGLQISSTVLFQKKLSAPYTHLLLKLLHLDLIWIPESISTSRIAFIVHSTLIDYLLFKVKQSKVHGPSQLVGILGLEYFPPPQIYTMVGKTIYLFRKQPTGCYRPVSELPCPSRFGRLPQPKESSRQARGSSLTSGASAVTVLWKLSDCPVV